MVRLYLRLNFRFYYYSMTSHINTFENDQVGQLTKNATQLSPISKNIIILKKKQFLELIDKQSMLILYKIFAHPIL